MALNLGGIIRLTYTVKNDLGVATNPAAATLTITQPDGTTATPTVTLPPVTTGLLVVDFTPAQAGLHSVHWATTGPTTAEDDMFVAERPGSLLVSVDEAVAHLRASGVITSDADREQLQWLCIVASRRAADLLARTVVPRTVTETYDGGSTIRLRSTPVISVASVVESGVTLTAGDYLLQPHGILQRGSTSSVLSWGSGWGNVTVTYRAGYADPSAVIRDAALNMVQGAWQSSQQAGHPLLDEQTAAEFVSTQTPALGDDFWSYRALGVA